MGCGCHIVCREFTVTAAICPGWARHASGIGKMPTSQKKVHVDWGQLAWCSGQNVKAASINTFLRDSECCREKLPGPMPHAMPALT